MINTRRLMLLTFVLILFAQDAVSAEERLQISFGDPLPELSLTLSGPDHDRSYLGLADNTPFTPSQIQADLLLLELLNVHCVHCQMQAPSYNELFKLIETNPETRGHIKMLGIALGNLPEEVVAFRHSYEVPFPIVADPRFDVSRALGASATPFSIYVRQGLSGQPGVVAKTYLGLNTDYRMVFAELKEIVSSDPAALRLQGAKAVRTRTAIAPLYGDEELANLVRKAFLETGGVLVSFRPVDLHSGRRVYTAVLRRDQNEVRLFAEVASRQSVCDICHDVHFIYVFDSSAKIVGFEPLQVTKYGNVLWNATDTEKMRQRVIGRYLTAPRPFDPKVDAVSSATISSSIIFDSISRGEELLKELHEKGY